jgi:DNA-binding winged helix-turn-helix (wHTH) protein
MAPIEAQSAEKLTFGPFEVDIRTAEFFRNGRKLRLSGQSAQLLVILIQRAGQLVSREDLRVILWPEDSMAISAMASTIASAGSARLWGTLSLRLGM